jgi:hypothetical protein
MKYEKDEISEEFFDENFTTVINHIEPDNEDHFETYGKEFDYVVEMAKTTNRVWTVIECDNDITIVSAGYHLVNRMYFLITEKDWPSEHSFVTWDKEMIKECEECHEEYMERDDQEGCPVCNDEEEEEEKHYCKYYTDSEVVPDEDGYCSLCASTVTPEGDCTGKSFLGKKKAATSKDHIENIAVNTTYIFAELMDSPLFFSNVDKAMDWAKEFSLKYPYGTNWEAREIKNNRGYETTMYEFYQEKIKDYRIVE